MSPPTLVTPVSSQTLYSVQIVQLALGVIETLLGFRFIFKLLGANPRAGLTQALYGITQPLVEPFTTVFQVSVVEGSVVEWATILAMVVYSLAAAGIVKLLVMNRAPESTERQALKEADHK